MSFLEQAVSFVFSVITENEEVKKFPKDFVTASMQWIRSWFLTDDPKTASKLADPARTPEQKKTIIELKLEDLMEHPDFKKELEQRLRQYSEHRIRVKNVIEGNATVSVKGNVVMGDQGTSPHTETYDEKNKIGGNAKVDVGGNLSIGDQHSVGAGASIQNINITHNYSVSGNPHGSPVKTPSETRQKLRNFIVKGQLNEVFNYFETHPHEFNETFILQADQLKTRWAAFKKNEITGILSFGEANQERNSINLRLLELIGQLD